MPRSEEILEVLCEKSLPVLETKPLCFSDSLVHTFYDHMPYSAREAIARSLAGKTGLALLVEVPSIAHLLEITGSESDPSKCALGTIRERFGVHGIPSILGSDPWWENAIHRPINTREAMRDLWYVFRIRRSYE